jgi:hypothetical protein
MAPKLQTPRVWHWISWSSNILNYLHANSQILKSDSGAFTPKYPQIGLVDSEIHC